MIILGTNSIKDTGFNVANSCRFNDGDSAYMHKTPGSSGNRRKFTFSCWIKKGDIAPGDDTCLFSGDNSGDDSRPDDIRIRDTGKLYVSFRNTNDGIVSTKRVLRDPSAWMNIVVAVDTEQSTAENRVKIYINGVQESNLEGDGSGSPTYPSEDHDCTGFGRDTKITVGARSKDSPDKFFDGYMAEVCYIDGSQLAANSFGEFDEDSPTIWKPKDVSGLTFGTNGFYLDFEDSSNLGNDANGGTDLTEVNLAATDQSTDTCTNNFCTLNPLIPSSGYTFSEGNCKFVTGSGDTTGAGVGTFGLTAGKWYWEVKIGESGEDWRNHTHGIISELTTELYQNVGGLQNDTGVTQWMNNDGGEVVVDGTATTADYGELAIDDILGIAFNADDSQITFLKNGSALVSNYTISTTRGTIFPFIKTGINTVSEVNWGGCSAFTVSSAASDANGYGNFEHAPPSGYLALCSKNLGSDGG